VLPCPTMLGIAALCCLWESAAPAASVSEVRVEGLQHTRPAVIMRELRLQSGQEMDSLRLQLDADALERLGIFAEVRAERDSLGALVWKVQELPGLLPVPNGRMSDADGLSLGGGLKSSNFLGEAIALEALLLLGGVTEWQVAASGGWIGPLPIGWDVFTNRSQREAPFAGGQETSVRNQLVLRWPTDQPLRGQAGIGYAWVREQSRQLAVGPNGRDWIPSVSGGLQWDNRDRIGLTRKGFYQEMTVERIGGPLGGDLDGWQFTSDSRGWMPLSERFGVHLSNLLDWQTGTVDAWRGFVVGGANSARFLPAAELHGRSEDLLNAELRYLVVPPHPSSPFGLPLYWGLQALAGAELVSAWDATTPDGWRMGPVAGMDFLIPYLQRFRLCAGWSRQQGGVVSFGFGLEEKTVAQRWKGR